METVRPLVRVARLPVWLGRPRRSWCPRRPRPARCSSDAMEPLPARVTRGQHSSAVLEQRALFDSQHRRLRGAESAAAKRDRDGGWTRRRPRAFASISPAGYLGPLLPLAGSPRIPPPCRGCRGRPGHPELGKVRLAESLLSPHCPAHLFGQAARESLTAMGILLSSIRPQPHSIVLVRALRCKLVRQTKALDRHRCQNQGEEVRDLYRRLGKPAARRTLIQDIRETNSPPAGLEGRVEQGRPVGRYRPSRG